MFFYKFPQKSLIFLYGSELWKIFSLYFHIHVFVFCDKYYLSYIVWRKHGNLPKVIKYPDVRVQYIVNFLLCFFHSIHATFHRMPLLPYMSAVCMPCAFRLD